MHAPLTQPIEASSPLFKARMAGFFWLMTIITGMFGFIAVGGFVVPGDAAATATNITAHESLARWAFAANIIATASYLCVTVLVYDLLRPVNRTVAFLGVLVSLLGCAEGSVSALLFFAPVYLLGGAPHLAAFTAQQLQAQALTLVNLSLLVNNVGMAFFGMHVLSIGYLIRRSNFLPRILGTLLLVGGVFYLANSFADFLALPFKTYVFPLAGASCLLGEGSLTVWLLVKGVNVKRWNEQIAD